MGNILKIYTPPHEGLSKKCEPIKVVSEEIRKLAQDMLATMYAAPGVGLAAPQVGHNICMFVIDVSEEGQNNQPLVMLNPRITWESDEERNYSEGCLSVPGVFAQITRPKRIKAEYMDLDGNTQTIEGDNLLATCIQHELDHLSGKLFIDRVSRLRRDMLLKKMNKHIKSNTSD